MRKPLFIAFAALVLVFVQLVVLRYLDYSTSYVSWLNVKPGDKMGKPTPDFSLGGFKWEVKKYETAKSLATLRNYFREKCGQKKGIEAASCVSLDLIEIIPKGTPKREIFNSNYSPERAFEKHLEGEQGYCTNYAGISAAMLLSAGVPARFLQIRANDGIGGHNIIEIWDRKYGWVLFDPFNNGLIEKDGKPLSAVEAHFAEKVDRVDAEEPGVRRGHLPDYYDKENRLRSALVYPEPWLYTRVGSKYMPLVRGSFVGFGEGYFKYSLAQNLLRIGIVLCGAMLLIAIFVAGLRGIRRSL